MRTIRVARSLGCNVGSKRFLRILHLPPVTGRLFLECVGERNYGFADLGVGKRGGDMRESADAIVMYSASAMPIGAPIPSPTDKPTAS